MGDHRIGRKPRFTQLRGPIISIAAVLQLSQDPHNPAERHVRRIIESFDALGDVVHLGETLVVTGKHFPGEGDAEPIELIITTSDDRVVGVRDAHISITGPDRDFGYSCALDGVALPVDPQFRFSLVHRGQEVARVYVPVHRRAGHQIPRDPHGHRPRHSA